MAHDKKGAPSVLFIVEDETILAALPTLCQAVIGTRGLISCDLT